MSFLIGCSLPVTSFSISAVTGALYAKVLSTLSLFYVYIFCGYTAFFYAFISSLQAILHPTQKQAQK